MNTVVASVFAKLQFPGAGPALVNQRLSREVLGTCMLQRLEERIEDHSEHIFSLNEMMTEFVDELVWLQIAVGTNLGSALY
jgi:hypothetical protein